MILVVLILRRSVLIPYTTLFRSGRGAAADRRLGGDRDFLREEERMIHPRHIDPARVLRGRDIVCFSNDWDGDPLSKTHIMKILRSEEHTSELQSREKLVCRLLLE